MTLSIGLDAALSALSTTADQTSIVSRNVARAGEPGASRKIANLVTLQGGGVKVASVTRAANAALYDKLLGATSDSAAQKAIVDALDRLDATINDPELDASPAALVGKLADALHTYATSPQDAAAARSAVAAATDLAQALKAATGTVQQLRTEADGEMAASVGNINALLARFETVNTEIVKGTRRGADVTDLLDERDQILTSISAEVGVRTVSRGDNDMAVYTDSGVTLFDVKARAVTFDRTYSLSASTTGNVVYADGVPITGNSGRMLAGSGRLTGLAAIRDTYAPTYQSQLDEIARGLVTTFAESDQSATPTLPDVPGLFTYSGAPAMPASGTLVVGLAGSIKVNANVDPSQGGNATRLRDGGISNPGNPAYVYNSTGAAGFSQRLEQLIDELGTPQAFDASAGLVASSTLSGFASSSVSWLQESRKSASADGDYKAALLERAYGALTKVTGVNLDEEMTLLLELERSYQASTRLVTTIDNMLAALLQAAG
jgi:flagellar hook-associated protein 1 FlgK